MLKVKKNNLSFRRSVTTEKSFRNEDFSGKAIEVTNCFINSYQAAIFILLFILSSNEIFSQQQDSLFIIPDSLSIKHDSLQVEKPKGKTYDVDTTVFATSKDSLIFFVKEKKMKIYGEGNINYKQTEIKSANIFIDFNSNYIDAAGIPSDTAKNKLAGTPVLKEGAEVYEGETMKYNFKTGQGLISLAQTGQEGSFYSGEKIKKVDKETYFIEDGEFTTCDDDGRSGTARIHAALSAAGLG